MASALELLTLALATKAPSVPLVTGSVASSAAETVIGTFTIPAGDPAAAAGSGYAFRVFGSADDTGTPALTLRLRLNSTGGTQIFSSISALTCRNTATNMLWFYDGWLLFSSGGSSASFGTQGQMSESLVSATPASHPNVHGPDTVDTTVQWSLVVTAQWGTGNAANIARTLAGALDRI